MSPELPLGVSTGVRVHRRVDVYTDAHEVWRRSRDRFPRSLRRFAGIAVDMVYDHFLARDWERYHAEPLTTFTATAYEDIGEHSRHFTPRLERIFPMMASADWLASYRDLTNTQFALEKMSGRSPRTAPLAETAHEMAPIYSALADDFELFFPDLRDAAETARNDVLARLSLDSRSCQDS